MEEVLYMPEGFIIGTKENRDYISTLSGLERAKAADKILEAKATVCDGGHNLIIDFGFAKGIIPREETAYNPDGKEIKDIAIITRVNKPVCFKITDIICEDGNITVMLSRRKVQKECTEYLFDTLKCGKIINAKITHLDPFGAFADIGCGIVSLISIDNISVSRISHPSDRFKVGQSIKAVVKEIDFTNRRISLSHKELLGTWGENAANFTAGQTVAGIIRSIEDYGIFIELAPNLAGLAEYRDGLYIGQSAAVYIKSIIPSKMKIKLSIIDAFENEYSVGKNQYYIHSDSITRWLYSPPECEKIIETVF